MGVNRVFALLDRCSELLRSNRTIASGIERMTGSEKPMLKLREALSGDLFVKSPIENSTTFASPNHARFMEPLSIFDYYPVPKLADELNLPRPARFNIVTNTNRLHRTISENSKGIIKDFESTFADIDGATLQSRVKSKDGMHEKTYRRIKQAKEKKAELEGLLTNATTEEEKKQLRIAIEESDKLQMSLITNVGTVHEKLGDVLGTRIILDRPTPDHMERIVKKLISGVKSGEFSITNIENYATDPEHFYLSKDQVDRIIKACEDKGIHTGSIEGFKESGYTTTQLNLVYRNGVHGELQIRGQQVHEAAEGEHLLYNMREGKDVTNDNEEVKKLLNPLYNALKELKAKPELDKAYKKYLHDFYQSKRDSEMLRVASEPTLPPGVPKVLDMNTITSLHHKLEEIQKQAAIMQPITI